MLKKLILFILSSVFSLFAYAQKDTSYKVHFYKGEISYLLNKTSKDWKNVDSKVTHLKIGTLVKLSTKAQLILSINNKYTIYDKEGIYTLTKVTKSNQKSFLAKFKDYIVENLKHHDEDIEHNNHELIEILGGVSRGSECGLLRPYTGTFLHGDSIRFTWKNYKMTTPFYLSIFNTKTKTDIYSIKLNSDTTIVISVNDLKLTSGEVYSWNLQNSTNYADCNAAHFCWLNQQSFEKYEQLLGIQSATNEQQIMDMYAAYSFLNLHFFEDAESYYLRAKMINPNQPLLKDFENDFYTVSGISIVKN